MSLTAKEKLRERVEKLSEEEAALLLAVVEDKKNRRGRRSDRGGVPAYPAKPRGGLG